MGNLEISRERPRIEPTLSFEEWLEDGMRNVSGSISHVNVRGKYVLLRPDSYQDKLLYFGMRDRSDDWRFNARLDGRVIFDVPPQDPPIERHANACNVRLQGFTPRGE